MAKNVYLEMVFPIRCRGRNALGEKVLSRPVAVKVRVSQPYRNEEVIMLNVKCRYNTGGHGQRCKASHPKTDKVGEGVGCPYALDIPYVLEKQ